MNRYIDSLYILFIKKNWQGYACQHSPNKNKKNGVAPKVCVADEGVCC
jgi:hypothetical protein